MFDLFAFVAESIAALYRADARPETRRMTIGCGLVVFLIVAVFALAVTIRRWG